MTVEDALRKIELLRRLSADKGAVPAEREAAYRLQKVLMERYSIKGQEVPEASSPTNVFRLNWSYWKELFDEFGLELNHFGSRGSAEIGRNSIAYITLATSQWRVEERTGVGWQTRVRDRGIESLRAYLKEHAPRNYSFLSGNGRRA